MATHLRVGEGRAERGGLTRVWEGCADGEDFLEEGPSYWSEEWEEEEGGYMNEDAEVRK